MTPDDYRRQRREIVRRHHPDVGGDADRLRRLLEELETRNADHSAVAGATTRTRRWRLADAQALAAAIDRLSREVRTRLPPRVPGSRRYVRISQP